MALSAKAGSMVRVRDDMVSSILTIYFLAMWVGPALCRAEAQAGGGQVGGRIQARDEHLDHVGEQAAMHGGALRHTTADTIVKEARIIAKGLLMIEVGSGLVRCRDRSMLIRRWNGVDEQRRQQR